MKNIITSIGLSLSLLAGFNAQANNGNKPHGSTKQTAFRLAPSLKEGVNYTGGHIIFKVKEQYRGSCSVSYISDAKLTPIFNYLGVNSLVKLFPMEKAPKKKFNALGQAYSDLSLTYEIKFSNKNVPLDKAINLMLSTNMFDFADPRYIRQTYSFTPNDPAAQSTATALKSQYNYLNRIKAFGAWDATTGTQGDTNVVIGIVDSGTDLLHPDLIANFKHNYGEIRNNHIDDDHDGYVDNYTGWDMAGADYNNIVGDSLPQIMGTNNVHGSHVSGCASAVTNNGIGVSGIGFKCKLLPVKCAADNDTRGTGGEGYIITGYEGIQYAASHGAKVINCSWGGTTGSSYEQSIITAATINYNCIVVAAAGNDALDEISYPAGYNYVLSVGATNAVNDNKASFSNWNYTVDLTAPGGYSTSSGSGGIYNTYYSTTNATNPQYQNLQGTSMATPITSGGVALVLSKYPTYTGVQAGQRLIATTDNNYTVTANSGYANKLGSGRLNLFAAVSSTVAAQGESVVFTNDSINDHNDLVFIQGDTLFIGGSFINYLNATTSAATASITAVTGGAYVTALNSSYPLGAMSSNTSKSNVTTPFKFLVGSAPLNTTLVFQVKITDGAYAQSYFFSVLLNPDYVNITINDVYTTITSKGKIGWSQDAEVGGLGFAYNGDNLLYEGGLMIGTSTTTVSDCIRGTNTAASDADFLTTVTAHKISPSVVSEFDVNGAFNDASASPTQNLLVRHNAYAWSTPGSSKFVIVEYIIHNTGTTALSNLYAGIFADWDIDINGTVNPDKSNYDATRKLGYTYATSAGGKFAGIQVLTSAAANSYGIDNIASGYGGVKIATTAGFTKADKYTTLSTTRLTAGDSTATGNDVCQVVSTGGFTIAAGDSVKVAFAILAGDDLTDLQASADTAYVRYNGSITTGINKVDLKNSFSVYPNPATDALNFIFNYTEAQNCTLSLINTLGQTVKVMTVNVPANTLHKVNFDVSDLASGAYFYKVNNASGKSNTGKILVSH